MHRVETINLHGATKRLHVITKNREPLDGHAYTDPVQAQRVLSILDYADVGPGDGQMHTSLGSYPLQAVCADGEVLCSCCVRDHLPDVLAGEEIQWNVVGVQVHWEGPDDYCAHCGKTMPTAYGDPQKEDIHE